MTSGTPFGAPTGSGVSATIIGGDPAPTRIPTPTGDRDGGLADRLGLVGRGGGLAMGRTDPAGPADLADLADPADPAGLTIISTTVSAE